MQTFIAHYTSPVGQLELRSDAEALQAILFVDTERRPGPGRTPTKDQPKILLIAARQLDEYFAGARLYFDLPQAQSGTAFQEKVWAELSLIPYGETISYLHLARRLGDEKCIRAAGLANGKNSLSILVPCHRVIGSKGDLIGYGGDLWRKKWLLQHEAAHAPRQAGALF
ncbi:MAG: methylated-DNA--[protein]-cysteine S-methyltransferase [Saprospiraceae bacterium]